MILAKSLAYRNRITINLRTPPRQTNLFGSLPTIAAQPQNTQSPNHPKSSVAEKNEADENIAGFINFPFLDKICS